MNWSVLGIEATKDKKAITGAYRSRLASVNPEDKPEEFMALRAAYEEALDLADQEEKPEEEKTPVELWRDRLDALYHDFPRRVRAEAWQELLADDLCIALDTRPLIEETLLVYFMENYHIPQYVWQYLDQTFDWLSRKEDLYEKFPKDFIDYVVVEGAVYSDTLPYDMYIPGRDGEACDTYLDLYRKVSRVEPEEQEQIIRQMKESKETHPYGQAWLLLYEIDRDHPEKIRDLELLCELYPEDSNLKLGLADAFMTTKKWEKAEQLSREVLEREPKKGQALWIMCQSLAEQEKFRDAVDGLAVLSELAAGNPGQQNQLEEVRFTWNERLIEQLKEQCRENSENTQLRYELAWCYMQNQRMDECREIAKDLSPDNMEPFGYYNLMSILASEDKDWEGSLRAVEMLCKIIPELKDDGTERTRQCMKRLPEMCHRRGEILTAMGRYDEALAAYEEARAMAPEKMEIIGNMAALQLFRKDYRKVLELSEEMLQINPGVPLAYYYIAMAHFQLGHDGEAYEAVNRAIEIDRSDLVFYVLKMRILVRNHVLDQAHALLELLQENDLGELMEVRFCEAILMEAETEDQEDHSELEALYTRIGDMMKEEGNRDWSTELFYRLAVLKTGRDGITGAELLETIDRGLEIDAEDASCLLFKAWVLKKDKRRQEAYQIYRKLEKQLPNHHTVLFGIGEYLYEDLENRADECLTYFERCVELNDDGDNRFYAGMCAMSVGQYEKAEEHFLREQEMEPDMVEGYYRLARLYQMMNRREDAIRMAEQTIVQSEGWENVRARIRSFECKIEILRRYGLWVEAVKTALEMNEACEVTRGYARAVEICHQFGQFKDAERLLKLWKKHLTKDDRERFYELRIKRQLYSGAIEKASMDLLRFRTYLSQAKQDEMDCIFCGIRGNVKEVLKYWMKLRKDPDRFRADPTHILTHLAMNYMRSGEVENARNCAIEAKRLLDPIVNSFNRRAMVYEGRLSVVLAILGDVDQAREIVKKMKVRPHCEGCEYVTCKDAFVWECRIEELCGDRKYALQLAEESLRENPDEEDFLELLGFLRRKK